MRSDQKIDQVKQSLDYIVGSLNPEDRFSVVSFSSTTEIFRESLRDATSDQKQSARQFIDNLSATGSTNLHGAITKALGMDPGRSERPFMVVLLTDGKPTAGQTTDPDEIIEAAGDANRRDARLFTVGVGYDVNSIFLDKLVEQHHGDRVYVTPDENLESRLSTFYGKIANPVLSELSLSIDGVRTRDVYPVRLPDLFKGSQLVLHGRYLGHGSVDVTLKGRRGGETVTIRRTINFPERRTDHDFLPRSWARVKIGHLIHQIRQHGMNDELKEELTRLSKEYGIVTEYTASLILEDEEMARAPQFRELRQEYSSRRDQLNRARDKAMSVGEGQASVRAAKQAQRFSSGEAMVEDEKGETSRTHIKQVGPKTFYRSGGIWYDRQYDEEESVEQIIYGGDRYFRLLERHPGLGRYFSLGKNVIVEYEGTFYHVRPRGETR